MCPNWYRVGTIAAVGFLGSWSIYNRANDSSFSLSKTMKNLYFSWTLVCFLSVRSNYLASLYFRTKVVYVEPEMIHGSLIPTLCLSQAWDVSHLRYSLTAMTETSPLKISRHGLSLVYTPPSQAGRAVAQWANSGRTIATQTNACRVIFIHGLFDHPEKTWTGMKPSTNNVFQS